MVKYNSATVLTVLISLSAASLFGCSAINDKFQLVRDFNIVAQACTEQANSEHASDGVNGQNFESLLNHWGNVYKTQVECIEQLGWKLTDDRPKHYTDGPPIWEYSNGEITFVDGNEELAFKWLRMVLRVIPPGEMATEPTWIFESQNWHQEFVRYSQYLYRLDEFEEELKENTQYGNVKQLNEFLSARLPARDLTSEELRNNVLKNWRLLNVDESVEKVSWVLDRRPFEHLQFLSGVDVDGIFLREALGGDGLRNWTKIDP